MPIKSIEYGLHSILETVVKPYGGLAPKGASLPFAIYTREATERTTYLKGNAGLAKATIFVTICDKTYVGAHTLAENIRLAMLNHRNETWGSFNVQGVVLQDESDIDVDATILDDANAGIFCVLHEYIITYKEEGAV